MTARLERLLEDALRALRTPSTLENYSHRQSTVPLLKDLAEEASGVPGHRALAIRQAVDDALDDFNHFAVLDRASAEEALVRAAARGD